MNQNVFNNMEIVAYAFVVEFYVNHFRIKTHNILKSLEDLFL